MRIGLFTDSPVFAGTERHMLELAQGLGVQGCEAMLICPGAGALAQRAIGAGISVAAVSGGIAAAVKQVRRLLKQGEVDLIHAHNGRTSLIAALAVTLSGRGKLIYTQHFIDPARLGRRGARAWASNRVHGWIEGRTAKCIAISQAVSDAMLRRRDVAAGKIAVVPNGICRPDKPDRARVEKLRQALDIEAASTLIACACRLEAEKDVATLVEAMAVVVRKDPNVICVHAGEGSQRDLIVAKVCELGLEKNFRLLGFRNDVNELVAAAEVFVLPSRAEPFGLVILEAMALGKPVIATAAGGPLEIVVDGKTGLLAPPSDPPALAAAILRLASDRALCEAMGAAGRERFEQHYTAERMVTDVLAVYREVLGEGASARGADATTQGRARTKERLEASNVGN